MKIKKYELNSFAQGELSATFIVIDLGNSERIQTLILYVLIISTVILCI